MIFFTAYPRELCACAKHSAYKRREHCCCTEVSHTKFGRSYLLKGVKAAKRRAPERWVSQLAAASAMERRRGLCRTQEGPTWVKLCPITKRSH